MILTSELVSCFRSSVPVFGNSTSFTAASDVTHPPLSKNPRMVYHRGTEATERRLSLARSGDDDQAELLRPFGRFSELLPPVLTLQCQSHCLFACVRPCLAWGRLPPTRRSESLCALCVSVAHHLLISSHSELPKRRTELQRRGTKLFDRKGMTPKHANHAGFGQGSCFCGVRAS